MKHLSSLGARTGIVALAVQVLFATCMPAAFAQQEPGAPRRGEPITLNFTNAEIESVARTMAVVTGRDVVVDPRVKGTVTLQTDRAIAPVAAFDQFAAALRLQGFAVVQTDGLYKVVPEADAKILATNVTTSTSGTRGVGGSQIVTQVFRLNYESPNNLLPVLRPLIAPNNTINVNPGNNSLVITDYADNMRRLARIIAALDVPNASDIEVIPLKHSVATDLVPLVQRLIDGGSGTAGAAAPGTADASFRTTLLAEPRSNSLILRAANPARAQLVRTLVERLDRPPIESSNGAAGNIYVIYLKNADAVRLAVTLRAALASDARGGTSGGGAAGAAALSAGTQPVANVQAGGAQGSSPANAPLNNANQPSTGGQIQADPATNSLIITASEPQYRQIRAVVDRLDGRRAQVMIESLIVEVNATKAAEFGVQWQSALGKSGDRNVGVIGTNSSLGGQNIIDLAVGLATSNTATRPSTGLNFGIGHRINGQYVLGFLARFLASNGEGNVLSTPNLLTLDNEEAKIVIGQNVPFVTGQYASTSGNTSTINPFTTVERKDVGLTMRVKPQINENGTIKLAIFQEVSNVDAATRNDLNGPTTNKRSIESNVLVEDGSVVLLGGLLQDDYSSSTEKIPLAGDIPILGNLFKSETRSRNKTNLMVFIRPVVMRDGVSTDAFSADRYDMIRQLQQGTQPQSTLPLNSVRESAVLAPLPEPTPTPGVPSDRRIEGTRLVPPPLMPMNNSRLGTGPLKGALPPTADPTSARELP
ncbi:type II secretion system secretin GspD [Variovorax sp. RT4R15]|uniref:type II secretion system secretin GspD n=1 Tax=Variovorax sp. RT4R15 TaxID=3443737 RepID=UPI003F481609